MLYLHTKLACMALGGKENPEANIHAAVQHSPNTAETSRPLGRDRFSSKSHPALSNYLSMISAKTLRVCREENRRRLYANASRGSGSGSQAPGCLALTLHLHSCPGRGRFNAAPAFGALRTYACQSFARARSGVICIGIMLTLALWMTHSEPAHDRCDEKQREDENHRVAALLWRRTEMHKEKKLHHKLNDGQHGDGREPMDGGTSPLMTAPNEKAVRTSEAPKPMRYDVKLTCEASCLAGRECGVDITARPADRRR